MKDQNLVEGKHFALKHHFAHLNHFESVEIIPVGSSQLVSSQEPPCIIHLGHLQGAPQPREFQEVHCWNQHLWESVGMQARSDCNHVPHFKAFQLWLLLLPNVLTLKPVAVAGGRAASENMGIIGIIWYDHHTPLWRQDMLKGFAFLQLNSSPFFSAEVSEVMCPHKLVSIQITWSFFFRIALLT